MSRAIHLKSSQVIPAACLLLALAVPAHADTVIKIRLSIKQILSPFDGSRPMQDDSIDFAIGQENFILSQFNRGYRYERVDPIAGIGTLNTARPNPGHYYQMDFGNNPSEITNFVIDSQTHKAMYAWDDNAINVFIYTGTLSFDYVAGGPSTAFLMIQGPQGFSTYLSQLIGHYMGLCDTQGCDCGYCGPGDCFVPGDDGISDTLPDLQCWTVDQIAQWNFGTTFAALNDRQQERVYDVYYNVMGLHNNTPGGRMTELQLDAFTDTANVRQIVTGGKTIFVDGGAGTTQNGSSLNPFDTVLKGLNHAGGGDIVLVRPGDYPENLRINAPVTLRAPRTGPALVGTHH